MHYLTIVSIFIHSISSSVSAFCTKTNIPNFYYNTLTLTNTRNACFKRLDSRTTLLEETSNPYDEASHNADNETQSTGIPALPPIGESASTESFRAMNLNGSTTINSQESSEPTKIPVAFVGSKKFEMQYTCNVCNKRNSNRVSRLAYTKGVVIVVCKGCGSKHLIADNLGWSNYIGGFETGETNIEEFLEAKGRSEDVNRVGPTVWELENTLAIDCNKNYTNCLADEDNTFE